MSYTLVSSYCNLSGLSNNCFTSKRELLTFVGTRFSQHKLETLIFTFNSLSLPAFFSTPGPPQLRNRSVGTLDLRTTILNTQLSQTLFNP